MFLINVPLGALAAATARLLIPESSAGLRGQRLPWPAVLIWAGALLSIVMALTEAARVGWLAPEVVTLGVAGIALLCALVAVERRAKRRLIAPSLLRSRQAVGANVLSLLSTAVMCNLFFFLALYLQLVLGYGTVAAGMALLPLTATIVLVAPLAGRWSERVGRRVPIVTGLLLLAAGLVALQGSASARSFRSSSAGSRWPASASDSRPARSRPPRSRGGRGRERRDLEHLAHDRPVIRNRDDGCDHRRRRGRPRRWPGRA